MAVIEVELDALEVVGKTALPALCPPGTLPPDYPTYDGLPILTMPHGILTPEGVEMGIVREGEFDAVGLGGTGQWYGDRGRWTFTIPMVFLTRAEAWKFMKFFDSRAGRAWPFWLASPTSDYTATAITTTTIAVDASGLEGDWDDRPWIAIHLGDGTVYIRGVASVVRSGGTDTVTFDAALPEAPVLADIRRTCIAYKCRFDSDELVEHWITTEHMQTEVSVIELLGEKSVTIAGLDRVATVPLSRAFSAPHCPGVQGDREGAPCDCPYESTEDGPDTLTVSPAAFVTWCGECNSDAAIDERPEFDGALPRRFTCEWYVSNEHKMNGYELLLVEVKLIDDESGCWWQLRAVCGHHQTARLQVVYRKDTGTGPAGAYAYVGASAHVTSPDSDPSCISAESVVTVSEA